MDATKLESRIRGVLKAHFEKKLAEGVTLDDTISSLDDIDEIIWEETGRGSECDFAEMDKLHKEREAQNAEEV